MSTRKVIEYIVAVKDRASKPLKEIGGAAKGASDGLDFLGDAAVDLATSGLAKAVASILAVDVALIALFDQAASTHLEIANLQVKFGLAADQAETLAFAAKATGMELEELANKVPIAVLDDFNGAVGRFVDTTGEAREQAFAWRAATSKLGLVLRGLADQMLIAFGPGMQRDLDSIGRGFLSMRSSIGQTFSVLDLFSDTFTKTIMTDWQLMQDLLSDPTNGAAIISSFQDNLQKLDTEFASKMAKISESSRLAFESDINAWEKLGGLLGEVTGKSFAEAVEAEATKALPKLGKAQATDSTSEFAGISGGSGLGLNAPPVVPAIEGMAGDVQAATTAIGGGLTTILAALGPAGAIAGAVIGLLQNLPAVVDGLVASLLDGVLGTLEVLPDIIVTLIGELIPEFIVGLVEALPELIPELIFALIEASVMLIKVLLVDLVKAIVLLIPRLVIAFVKGFANLFNPFKRNKIADEDKKKGLFRLFGVFDKKTPKTRLASGGIVTRPTEALVGEAGPEAVIPLNKAGGGMLGGTFNFNIGTYTGTDEGLRDLMREIRRMLGSRGLGEAGLA